MRGNWIPYGLRNFEHNPLWHQRRHWWVLKTWKPIGFLSYRHSPSFLDWLTREMNILNRRGFLCLPKKDTKSHSFLKKQICALDSVVKVLCLLFLKKKIVNFSVEAC